MAPHAPGSEFSLLVMVGMVAAYMTYQLGVYYLVGAFVAGLVAGLLRIRMPLLASDATTLRVLADASGGSPSIDVALVMMERAYGLPVGAAFTLFAIARTAGLATSSVRATLQRLEELGWVVRVADDWRRPASGD